MFTKLKVAWKDYKSEVKEIWDEEMSDYHPIKEIKVVWKNAWNDYRSICANARAEAQVKRIQKEINASKD